MRNLESLMCDATRVFLPNRYQQPFRDSYQDVTGREVPAQPERKLKVVSQNVEFTWVRGRDVPKVLARLDDDLATSSIGLTGTEWFIEYQAPSLISGITAQSYKQKQLGTVAKLSIAKSKLQNAADNRRKVEFSGVITPYPNLTTILSDWKKLRIWPVIEVSGCSESVAASLGMDAIDLVSSGNTARANGFDIVTPLMTSYVTVVYSADLEPIQSTKSAQEMILNR